MNPEPTRADGKAQASILSAVAAFEESLKAQETGHLGAEQEPATDFDELAGERGESSLHRARSLQSRASQVLALTLMGTLAVGLLGWYYLHTFSQRGTAQRIAQPSGWGCTASELGSDYSSGNSGREGLRASA